MKGLNSTLSRSLGPAVLGVASREMDHLFDQLIDGKANGNGNHQWMPPMSVWEEGEYFHLELELAGLSHDDIELTFEDSRLKVAANRSRCDSEGRKYLHDERSWGEFTRLISIPESVDPDSIEANYNNGLLHVKLQKRPEVMPKRIAIVTK